MHHTPSADLRVDHSSSSEVQNHTTGRTKRSEEVPPAGSHARPREPRQEAHFPLTASSSGFSSVSSPRCPRCHLLLVHNGGRYGQRKHLRCLSMYNTTAGLFPHSYQGNEKTKKFSSQQWKDALSARALSTGSLRFSSCTPRRCGTLTVSEQSVFILFHFSLKSQHRPFLALNNVCQPSLGKTTALPVLRLLLKASANNKGSQAGTTMKFITQFSTKILDRENCQQPVLAAAQLL